MHTQECVGKELQKVEYRHSKKLKIKINIYIMAVNGYLERLISHFLAGLELKILLLQPPPMLLYHHVQPPPLQYHHVQLTLDLEPMSILVLCTFFHMLKYIYAIVYVPSVHTCGSCQS